MRDRDERERERGRDASRGSDENAGDPNLGDTNLGDEATFGTSTEFDESFGEPGNIVGGPSDPGVGRDPTRPLAEGANDPAVSDPPADASSRAPGRDRSHGGWGDEGIAGGRAGGTGP